MDEIQNAIRSHYPELSKTQKKIAEKVLHQPSQYFMLHIADCAARLNVSEASLTRFARAVGFNGYNELKSLCQADLMSSFGIREKIVRSQEEPPRDSSLMKDLLEREQDNFSAQIEEIDYAALEKLSRLLSSADTVYITGLGVASTLVKFLAFRLRRMGVNVRELAEGGYALAESLTLLKREDALLAIGFRRVYDEVLTAVEYGVKVGCPVFAITESPLSQLALSAGDYAVVKRGPDQFLNSVAFPIAVCNAVAVMVARLKKQEVTDTVDNLEWLNRQLKKNFGGENK